jgi:hypothetical protein
VKRFPSFERTLVRAFLFWFCLAGGCSLWLAVGCGSSSTPTSNASSGSSGSSGSAGSGAQSASSGAQAGSGAQSGGAGAQEGSQSAAGSGSGQSVGDADAGVPEVSGDAGRDGSVSADATGAQPDCTPSAWKDPGTVRNPVVAAVSADAGTHSLEGATQSFPGLAYYPANNGLSDYDYVEDEFFFTGTSPAYTTRMVVQRPKDPAKFSGTVLMEWYNVTGGIDIAPLWVLSREYMMRAGHVHVGVSAQKVGADALKKYDPARYAPINHPGDSAANMIFSQAAMAVRSQTDTLLGRCMPVQAVVAIGQSQSSVYLTAYLNSQQPTDKMFDGFFLHTDPSGTTPTGNPVVPTFVLFTMTEGAVAIDSQPNVVQWEVAGATHNDDYLTTIGALEVGGNTTIRIACANPMNIFPSFWAWDAALDGIHRWVRKGVKPPSAPELQTTTDQYGNAQGGARIPDIDVPIATYTKSNKAMMSNDTISAFACALSGSVVPLTSQQLLTLYPTHDAYVQAYVQAADKALAAGFEVQADHDIAIQMAKAAKIPN